MKTGQFTWQQGSWKGSDGKSLDFSPDLTLIFGQRMLLENGVPYEAYAAPFRSGQVVIGSTSGNILGNCVSDDDITATAIKFKDTKVQGALFQVQGLTDRELGEMIGTHFLPEVADMRLLYVIADGLSVNGSALVEGIGNIIGPTIPVAGGLAGDDARFQSTLVGLNGKPGPGQVAVVTFHGDSLEVGCGTRTGWEPFGPERVITRSMGNVVHEIDGKGALALYKSYLGDRAAELPGSALLFPLEMVVEGTKERLIRTILSVNEDDQSMTFAGNIPQGSTVRLMKANFEKLIDGAADAAGISRKNFVHDPELALLVSCVGRKLILGQRTEEEIEEASAALGAGTTVAGFYSYGEIAPLGTGDICHLHNQSMTITSLRER